MKPFKNGLITGLVLQLAIGPVFFFIINLTLQKSLGDGFAGVIAVTLGDYLYITLAILGIGKLLEKKKIKKALSIISSIILILFGIFMIKSVLNSNTTITANSTSTNLLSSFSAVFFLTISSPITIVMWTSLFITKAVENNYSKRELFIFGLSAGLATLLFMGTAVIILSSIKSAIPTSLIQILNIIVGSLLILYGLIRLKKNA